MKILCVPFFNVCLSFCFAFYSRLPSVHILNQTKVKLKMICIIEAGGNKLFLSIVVLCPPGPAWNTILLFLAFVFDWKFVCLAMHLFDHFNVSLIYKTNGDGDQSRNKNRNRLLHHPPMVFMVSYSLELFG